MRYNPEEAATLVATILRLEAELDACRQRRNALVVAWSNAGMSLYQIGQRLGISAPWAHQILQRVRKEQGRT